MANQMDNLIEQGIRMSEEFDKWVFEVCSFKSIEPNDLNLTDAKLSFLDGVSSEDYSKRLEL